MYQHLIDYHFHMESKIRWYNGCHLSTMDSLNACRHWGFAMWYLRGARPEYQPLPILN